MSNEELKNNFGKPVLVSAPLHSRRGQTGILNTITANIFDMSSGATMPCPMGKVLFPDGTELPFMARHLSVPDAPLPNYTLRFEEYEDFAKSKHVSLWVGRNKAPGHDVVAGDIWFSTEANEYWFDIQFANAHIVGLIFDKLNQLNAEHKARG